MRLQERYRRLNLWNKLAVWGVIATFVSLALAVVWRISDSTSGAETEPPFFEGRIFDAHAPNDDDARLMDFIVANETSVVRLELLVGADQGVRSDVVIDEDGTRHYSIALSQLPKPWLMDLLLSGRQSDDLFVAGWSNTLDIVRGTFKVKGCVTTGPGWEACELVALPL